MNGANLFGKKHCAACGATIPAASSICPNCRALQAYGRSDLGDWSVIAGLLALLRAVPPGKKRCVACGAEIEASSYVCSTCKEFQAPWRNELRYWAAIAGLLALIGSGIALVTGFAKSGIDYLSPPDLVVLDFNAFGDIVVANSAEQPLLVKYLFVQSTIPDQKLRWSVRWDINTSMESSKALTVNLPELAKKQFRGIAKEMFAQSPGLYAQNQTDDLKREIFQYRKYKEFVPAFLKDGGTEYRQLVEDIVIGPRITTFPCAAEINYLFLRSQRERTNKISCIGVIRHRSPADDATPPAPRT